MNTHHVCFSASLACSGVNPCRLCLDAMNKYVLGPAMRQAGIPVDQGRVFWHYYIELFDRLHAQMGQDPQVAARSLDLSRVRIEPASPPLPQVQATVAPFPVPFFAREAAAAARPAPSPMEPPVARPPPAPQSPLGAPDLFSFPAELKPAMPTGGAAVANTSAVLMPVEPAPPSTTAPAPAKRAASPSRSSSGEMTIEDVLSLASPADDGVVTSAPEPSHPPESVLNGAGSPTTS